MPEQEDEARIVQKLRSIGGRFRFRKSGRCHTVDLSDPAGIVNDDVLRQVAQLERLAVINLSGSDISAGALEALAGLEKLESLDLSDTAIGDEVLPYLGPLADRLRILVLTNTHVSADAIKAIRKQMINTRIIQLS